MNKCSFNSFKNPCIHFIKGHCTISGNCPYKITNNIDKDKEIARLNTEITKLKKQLKNSITLPYAYNTFGGRRQLVYGKYYILKKTPHGSLTTECFSTKKKQLTRLEELKRGEEK